MGESRPPAGAAVDIADVIPIVGVAQHYAWGDHETIPRLLGTEPDGRPVAELWLGTHRRGPATLDPHLSPEITRLDQLCRDYPQVTGGIGDLPYLVKLLAASKPLSLQAHPTRAQAQAGYARENAAGIALDDPTRYYVDDNHKPELVVALTPFRVLAGIRRPDRTLAIIDRFDCGDLDRVVEPLRTSPDSAGVAACLRNALALSGDSLSRLTTAMRDAAEGLTGDESDDVRRAADLVVQGYEAHGDDPGLAAALLLNDVTLQPGEGMFTPAGMLHAYVRGFAVEVMANSDNVLRGGWTTKHVDVDELLAILDTTPGDVAVIRDVDGSIVEYPVPVPDFTCVAYREPRAPVEVGPGPRIVLCVEDSVTVESPTCGAQLHRGKAVFVPEAAHAHLTGSGTIFVVGTTVDSGQWLQNLNMR